MPRSSLTRLTAAGLLDKVGGLVPPARSSGLGGTKASHDRLHQGAAEYVLPADRAAVRPDPPTTAPDLDLAMPARQCVPRIDHPPVKMVQMTGDVSRGGHRATPCATACELRVGVAKTVVDCFKHRNKIGLDVALEALKDVRAKRKATRTTCGATRRSAAWPTWCALSGGHQMNDIAASIARPPAQRRQGGGCGFNQVLVRFALGASSIARPVGTKQDRFLLKGALLFALWYDLAAPGHARRRPARLRRERSGIRGPGLPRHRRASRSRTASCSARPRSSPRKSCAKRDERRSTHPHQRRAGQGTVQDADRHRLRRCRDARPVMRPIRCCWTTCLHLVCEPTPSYRRRGEASRHRAVEMTNSRVKDYLDLSVLLARETWMPRPHWRDRGHLHPARHGSSTSLPVG